MAICEFCGKEIPDGGICSCEEALAAAEEITYIGDDGASSETESDNFGIEDIIKEDAAGDTPTEETEVSPDEIDSLHFLDSAPPYVPVNEKSAEPALQRVSEPVKKYQEQPQQSAEARPVQRRRVSRKTLMRRRRCALAVIVLMFFMCCSFIKNHTGCRGAVHRYWDCVVDEDGGTDYYSMGLPKVLINHFKDTGEWNNLIGNYESLSEKAVKLKKIKKVKRMSKDELRDAEDYLYDLAHYYGAKTVDGEIVADKGYFVTVIYKFGEDRILGGAYYVKMEDDCWKVLPQDINK